jgi:hypothetical protein
LSGRPSKFKETSELFIAAIASGQPMGGAAAVAGIALSTVKSWLTAGRQGGNDQFTRFLNRYQQARAVGLKNTVTEIREKGATDWRATAWLGERLYPEELCLKQSVINVSATATSAPVIGDMEQIKAKLLAMHEAIRQEALKDGNGEQLPTDRFNGECQ